MGKFDNVKLEELLNKCGIIFGITDIVYFCQNEDIIKKYIDLYKENSNNLKVIKNFLIENENEIDKEKLLFCLYLNYSHNLDIIRAKIKMFSKGSKEYNLYIKEEKLQSEFMNKVGNMLRSLDIYIIKPTLEEERMDSTIYSSRELILNRKKSGKRNFERLNEIDNEISEEGNGSIHLLQALILSDLKFILPDEQVGLELRECILTNAVYRKGEYTSNQLSYFRENDYNRFLDIIDNIEPEYFLPELREELIKNIRFIDFDRMLLLIAYRYEEYLEDEGDLKNSSTVIKVIIDYLKDKIKDKNVCFNLKIEKRVTFKPKEVKYSYKDLEKFSDRFIGESYITKREIDNTKQALKIGEISINDIDTYLMRFIDFEPEEFEEIMHYSDENFACIVESFNFNEEKILNKFKEHPESISINIILYLHEDKRITINTIIELYSEGLISKEFVKELSGKSDIFLELGLTQINQHYNELKKQREPDENDLNKLDKEIELFKLLNLEDKTEEELQELSDSVMYEIAEYFEDEQDIMFYYEKGLITLQTVSEWGGEFIILKLYDESKISFEDIDKSNISIEIKRAVFSKKITAKIEEYETEELLEIIYKGYLSEEDILSIYKLAILNETYAEEMLNRGIITVPTYIEIISITKEKLEEQANTKISEVISMDIRSFSLNIVEDEMEESNLAIGHIPESKKENREKTKNSNDNSSYRVNVKDSETLIDPNIRWEFLKALRCKLPKDKDLINDDPNNPFHNYEFFVIEGKDDNDIEKDSIVIGERFFKDKEKEGDFATSNATYIWQYKDYLVTRKIMKNEQGKNKRAVLKETSGVIYVANHRPGSWAVSLLYKIAQAKAGVSFEKYKGTDKGATKVLEQLEKLYTHEELSKILDLAKIIDDDQKVIREDGREVGIIYDVIQEDKRIVGHNGDER